MDRSPAALPAAPSVVAIATNRQITISAIPYIIIYIRAVTLLYMAAHFVASITRIAHPLATHISMQHPIRVIS